MYDLGQFRMYFNSFFNHDGDTQKNEASGFRVPDWVHTETCQTHNQASDDSRSTSVHREGTCKNNKHLCSGGGL